MTVSWEGLTEVPRTEVVAGGSYVAAFDGTNLVKVTRIVGERVWGHWYPTLDNYINNPTTYELHASLYYRWFLLPKISKPKRTPSGFSQFIQSKGL